MVRHIASNALTLLIVALILLGGVIVWGKVEFDRPGSFTEDAIFEVKPGDRLGAVSKRLGLIANARIFRIAARYSGDHERLKFGEYKVPAKSSMRELMALVTSGRALAYQITIPEGLTSYQVIEKLKEHPILTGELAAIPPEGSLAPNTYAISKGDTLAGVVERMTAAQSKILADAWEGRAKDLPLKTPEEALILASIVEKETGVDGERPLVASVFINRLERGMRLQTDPTVIYGLTDGKGVLGRGIRRSELQKKTPYNTYQIDGLPPTPIANPGKTAIEATLNPANTDFVFFVADGTGGHVFSATISEHNQNVRAWRKIEAERKAAEKKAAEEAANAGADQ